jgi:hypothetical protein
MWRPVDAFENMVSVLSQQDLRPLGLQMLATRLHHRTEDIAQLTAVASQLVADPQLVCHTAATPGRKSTRGAVICRLRL